MDGFVINASIIPQPPHPFYPVEANIVGYLANEWSMLQLLAAFGSGCAVILGLTLAVVMRHNPTLPPREKATILWFVLCKFHIQPRGRSAIAHTVLDRSRDHSSLL